MDEWRESDRARRRKSDVQEKVCYPASRLDASFPDPACPPVFQFYNFLNRSAQSLSRSNSQTRTRRTRHKDTKDSDRDGPRAPHAATSRLPDLPGSPEKIYTSVPPTYTHRTTGSLAIPTVPYKSSSPPLSPRSQHRHHAVPNPSQAKTNIANTYSTPPQTPSRSNSRNPSSPSSPSTPTAGRGASSADLLLNRPIARPITPSNSSPGRKVLGIRLPSPKFRKASLVDDEHRNHSTHLPRSGSGSSSEPLLQTQSRTSEQERVAPRQRTSTTHALATQLAQVKVSSYSQQTVLPTPATSNQSHRIVVYRDETPVASVTPSRKSTPKFDFWRSVAPRPPSAQGETNKGKQRGLSPDTEAAELHKPQPRAPVAFLPEVPRLHRTPPTPRKGELRESGASPRVDSFMSDSIPIPQVQLAQVVQPTPHLAGAPHTRRPAFVQGPKHVQTPAPCPTEKPAPVISIQRSRSAPGSTRGRISPCLRIPSPKFLNRDRDKSKEREREKDTQREKRRVTPESVGSPILRDQRAHVPLGEKNALGLKATLVKPPTTFIRRAAHGSFDFERPGSRGSSKSGHSESENEGRKGEKVQGGKKEVALSLRADELAMVKQKASSPVPPLPIPHLKPHSPPPHRTRSPLATSPARTEQSRSTATATHVDVDIDDSALPRLSSSLGRRNTSISNHRAHRTQASLPAFSFEPAAPSPSSSKLMRDPSVRSGMFVDPHTGLMWAPTRLKDNAIQEDGTHVHFSGIRRARSPVVGGGKKINSEVEAGAIPPRELEAATAVIVQFKSVLDDAGFATLQKYVRRYDAQIIPLEGAAGLLVRVQRLLETSAPRVDERRKRQLLDSFIQIVSQVS
ncbi:hypothetical protein EW145_g125 [Phellinidium pouzarii]|uniref:Uncharacterized protein n=1 Tax=Phellinidium pouzarii TaxID=167371 RepID=A0A4S4LJK8_9AGAM|nr:hypothetical protein EW145_g125 [Phellinidium pouzarii]